MPDTQPTEETNSLWDSERLTLPLIPESLKPHLSHYDYAHLATQRTPSPIDDYLFHPAVDYLKTSIPDQYSVSHAGHGINSYALNFRFAYGPLALLLQTSFGGAYGDPERDKNIWNESLQLVVPVLRRVMQHSPRDTSNREMLILSSNFRGIGSFHAPELYINHAGQWEKDSSILSWGDILSHL